MILVLRFIFSLILITMLIVTSTSEMHEHIFKIPAVVTSDPWFIATMFDAYFGFLTFYCWVVYRTPSWLSRVLWFLLIMVLGNMAMASYMLIILLRLPLNAKISDILLRPEHRNRQGA